MSEKIVEDAPPVSVAGGAVPSITDPSTNYAKQKDRMKRVLKRKINEMAARPKARIQSALKKAASTGYDPYNSHPTQESAWKKKQKDYMRKRADVHAKKGT